jgi:hypothetical protein
VGSGEALSEDCAEGEGVALAQPVLDPNSESRGEGEPGAVLLGKADNTLTRVEREVGDAVTPRTVGLTLLLALSAPLGEAPEGDGSAVASASAVLMGRAVV